MVDELARARARRRFASSASLIAAFHRATADELELATALEEMITATGQAPADLFEAWLAALETARTTLDALDAALGR